MSEDLQSFEHVDSAIEAITQQIQLLSNRCKLEDNKKSNNFEQIIEASSLMLQLSRTLNELLVTKRFLENSQESPVNFLNSMMNGRVK